MLLEKNESLSVSSKSFPILWRRRKKIDPPSAREANDVPCVVRNRITNEINRVGEIKKKTKPSSKKMYQAFRGLGKVLCPPL